MEIGKEISSLRELKGMTHKYLGVPVVFPKKTADIRMAQYEAGSRKPKADLIIRLHRYLKYHCRL